MSIPGIGITWAEGGAIGVLLATILGAVWLIYTGRLQPQPMVEARIADRDARIAAEKERADNYESAWRKSEETHPVLIDNMTAVLETMRTMESILQEVRSQGASHTVSRGGDVS